MNRLKKCVKAFEKMLDVQYHVIVARKGKVIDLFIDFMPIDFHHLMGLGKLKDLRVATQNREQVFQKILIDSITEETIKKSRYYSLIQKTFQPVLSLYDLTRSAQIEIFPKCADFLVQKQDFAKCGPRSTFSERTFFGTLWSKN